MKINYNKEPDPLYPTFDNLSLADTFFLLSDSGKSDTCPYVYMVIEEGFNDTKGQEIFNAVCLNDGRTYWIRNEAKVIPLEASLSISKKLVF